MNRMMRDLALLLIACLLASALVSCAQPSASPTPTIAPATADPTNSPTAEPPPDPTPSPTPEPTPSPTPEPTPTPQPTATVVPTPTPFAGEGAPAVIGLYDRKSRKLVTGYTGKLTKAKDIVELFVLPTTKKSVEKISQKALVEKYWNDNREKGYRIGYRVNIELESGEVIILHIRSPKDAPKDPKKYFYQFVEIYMYDSTQKDPDGDYGTWHLQERFMKETTLIAKMKLHAGSRISEVVSINLQAFVYKGDGDFDPQTGEYTGPVSCEITIKRSK